MKIYLGQGTMVLVILDQVPDLDLTIIYLGQGTMGLEILDKVTDLE